MQKLPYTEISTLFGVKPNSLDSAQTTTPGIISGERFDNIKYTVGTKTRLTTIENVNPETIVTANGCNISEPSPNLMPRAACRQQWLKSSSRLGVNVIGQH